MDKQVAINLKKEAENVAKNFSNTMRENNFNGE